MNDSLTIEQKKSRRGLLALVGAGGAAAVATLLGRSNRAEAHGEVEGFAVGSDPGVHGDSTVAGAGVLGTGSGGGPGVWGGHTSGGDGVYGASSGLGVHGYSSGDAGVRGIGTPGVRGDSPSGTGIEGESTSGVGVKGSSGTTAGVVGTSTVVPVPVLPARLGVLGAGDDIGVAGSSTSGTGVKGLGKPGVYGVCYVEGGAGVRGDGEAPGSVGVFANNTPGRQALRTEGQVQMDCARKVTLSNRTSLVTLPTGVRAGSNAIVLAMVQGPPGNEAFVRRAFRVDSTHIRITFNKKPDNPTAVGYWVLHTG